MQPFKSWGDSFDAWFYAHFLLMVIIAICGVAFFAFWYLWDTKLRVGWLGFKTALEVERIMNEAKKNASR